MAINKRKSLLSHDIKPNKKAPNKRATMGILRKFRMMMPRSSGGSGGSGTSEKKGAAKREADVGVQPEQEGDDDMSTAAVKDESEPAPIVDDERSAAVDDDVKDEPDENSHGKDEEAPPSAPLQNGCKVFTFDVSQKEQAQKSSEIGCDTTLKQGSSSTTSSSTATTLMDCPSLVTSEDDESDESTIKDNKYPPVETQPLPVSSPTHSASAPAATSSCAPSVSMSPSKPRLPGSDDDEAIQDRQQPLTQGQQRRQHRRTLSEGSQRYLHVFHDKLSTLYEETPYSSGDEADDEALMSSGDERSVVSASSLSDSELTPRAGVFRPGCRAGGGRKRRGNSFDEKNIRARWDYALQMMSRVGQCGQPGHIYDSVEGVAPPGSVIGDGNIEVAEI